MEVSGDALQAALAQAIAQSVTPELQGKIFRDALESYLFATVKDSYSGRDKPPPIREAFQKALDRVTAEIALAVVNEPENRKRIDATIREAFDNVMEDGSLSAKLTEKMHQTLRW